MSCFIWVIGTVVVWELVIEKRLKKSNEYLQGHITKLKLKLKNKLRNWLND